MQWRSARTIATTTVTFAIAALAALVAAPTAAWAAEGFQHGICTSFDPGNGACEEWPGDPTT